MSDIGMPGEDGYELIRRLRALPPDQGGAIPAVALTALARPEDRRRALPRATRSTSPSRWSRRSCSRRWHGWWRDILSDLSIIRGMDFEAIEARLREFFAANAEREGIAAAYLFGSVARGTAGPGSDVDIGILYLEDPPLTLDGHGLPA